MRNHNCIYKLCLVCKIIVFILVFGCSLIAQHNKDVGNSHIDSLLNEAISYRKTNPIKSVELLGDIKSKIKLPQDREAYYSLLINYSLVYFSLQKNDSCIYYANQYIDIASQLNDTIALIEAHQNIAHYYQEYNQFVEEEDALINALKLVEVIKDTQHIISCSSSLASMLRTSKRLDRAKHYLIYAQGLASAFKQKRLIAVNSVQLGIYFQDVNDWDSARYYFKLADPLLMEESNYYISANCNYHLAMTYKNSGNFELAYQTLDTAETRLQKINAPFNLLKCKILRAEIYVADKKFKAGIELFNSILINNSNQLNFGTKHVIFTNLCKAYLETGDNTNALLACDSSRIFKDSLLSETIVKEVQQLEVAYRTEKKEKEVNELTLKNELSLEKLRNERLRNYGLLTGILLLSGLVYWINKLYNRTKSQKEIIEKNLSEKEILLREIHHRVKNNLQFISSLLNLQSRHLTDTNALRALKEGQNRVKSMALIHQNLYQEGNLIGVDCKVYFESLVRSLFNSYNISSERIQLIMEIEEIKLDLDTMIPMGLIVNELISNALKYAFPDERKGEIFVSLKEEKNSIFLKVEDNGIGISVESQDALGKSFGYRLIKSLSDQLDANFEITNISGTKVYIQLAPKAA